MKHQQTTDFWHWLMQLTKTFQHKCTRMSCTERQLRIVHPQEVGHVLRPKNKLINTGHRKVESSDTLLIFKMAILGWRKQLSKISMNFILIRILAMILAQHANEDMDMVAEEEELQALTNIKWDRAPRRNCAQAVPPCNQAMLNPGTTLGSSPSCTNPSAPNPSHTTPSSHTHRYGLMSHWQLDNQVILLMCNYYMAC